MQEQSNQSQPQHKLFDDLQRLTNKAMANITLKMQDPEAMVKYAKEFRDIAITLEKLSKIVLFIVKTELELNPLPPPPEPPIPKVWGLEDFEVHREQMYKELAYWRKREAEEEEDLDLYDPRNPCNRRPPSILETNKDKHDATPDHDEADP